MKVETKLDMNTNDELKKETANGTTPVCRCSGIELIIKGKRYWFEFFGRQITEKDFYTPNSSFARMLHIACT